MPIGNYLKTHQPIIYKVFSNAIKNKKLSHAYLLSGTPGTPLLETAIFLAQSILCEEKEEDLACETCLVCRRIEEGNFSDLIIFDGSKETIKKGDVLQIEERFSKTALEISGKCIYILHLVENMTSEAVNSILKFLEEPGKEIYAILTSENENKILPTILSRAQVLRLKTIDKSMVIDKALSLGVAMDDSEILANFYQYPSTILKVSSSEEYQLTKSLFTQTLEALSSSRSEGIHFVNTSVISSLKSKENIRFFLDLLAVAFKDLLAVKRGDKIVLSSYGNILEEMLLTTSKHDITLKEIMVARGNIDLNVNSNLLLNHVMFNIKEKR